MANKFDGMEIVVRADDRTITIKEGSMYVTLTYNQAAALVEFLAWAGRERCQAEVDDDGSDDCD